MRRVVCNEIGRIDELVVAEGEPSPEAKPGWVVVNVAAAGVNYADALVVAGRYQLKPPVPFTPGGEIAGTVTAIGEDVTGWEVGDRVMAMVGLGGYTSRALVPATSLIRIPEQLDEAQAAGFIQSYCTALFALAHRTSVALGETVVVLGAGGGVGLAAVDVATALGAKVIAAASTPEKRQAALDIGASEAIDYDTEDLKSRVRELTDGGADIVFDAVGGPHAEPALRSLGNLGRYLVIGFAAGEIPSVPLNQVLLRNRTVVGVDWGAWSMSDGAGQIELLHHLVSMVEDGSLTPPHPTARPLADVVGALTDLLERRVTGKVVLVP